MILNVVYDLRIFLLFYTILIFMFSQMYSVLGLGIIAQPSPFRDAFLDDEESAPNFEYKSVGMFVG
jgi:hypothetical protein